MTPAEQKFSSIEAGLKRAQCLVRVLRELTETNSFGDPRDSVLSNGIYVIVAEAEDSLDAAAALWAEAHEMAADRHRS